MELSILVAISKWIVKTFKLEESLSEVGTDVLQEHLWNPLKNRIKVFFSDKDETQQFIERLSTETTENKDIPRQEVNDLYKKIKGEYPSDELFDSIVDFFKDNQKLIKKINKLSRQNRVNITYDQKAEKIFNFNGGVQHFSIHD